jgi:torulene dioxygenase
LSGITFGQKRDPCTSFFQKLKSVFDPQRTTDPYMSNAGVTITSNPSGIQPNQGNAKVNGKHGLTNGSAKTRNFAVLKTDNSQMKTIDMETLEPIGVTAQSQLHPDLKGPMSCAHAQYDHANGDVFNYNLDFGPVSTYRVFKTSLSTGNTDILATIQNPLIPGAYVHSFFLTEDFVILGIWGSHFQALGIKILWDRNILDAIAPLDPKAKTKWLVVDRKKGRGLVATFESPAVFSFHSVNAWQTPSKDNDSNAVDIICDVVQYPTLDILHRLYYENLISTGPGVSQYVEEGRHRAGSTPSLARYKLAGVNLDSKSKGGHAEIVLRASSPLVGDLPTINPLYSTKPSRYVYSLIDRGYSSFVDGISKYDTVTEKATTWMHEKHTPGEAIFVPDPSREGEDGGFLLSCILDGEKGTSYLICLDAETMEEVGRADCGVAVGIGFHGSHDGL